MKRFYYSIRESRWLRVLTVSLFLISFILYGCFKLKSLDHPTNAYTQSYFDVAFVCEPDTDDKTEARGYFGVLMPQGWEPQQETDFTIFYPDGVDDINGKLIYNKDYTDALNNEFPAPQGYYWWGGRSTEDLEIVKRFNKDQPGQYDVKCLNFSFKFRIFTDSKTGDFNLRYVIGTNGNSQNPVSNGKYVDENRTITITENPNPPVLDNIEVSQSASQPTYAFTDIDISFNSVKLVNHDRLFFGALLPEGWRVEDYTHCKVTDEYGAEKASGLFSYDQYYSDRLQQNFAAPKGYYWWGGRTIDNLSITPDEKASFTFRVYNDNKIGDFNLRYIISAGPDNAIKEIVKDETLYPMNITQGNTIPLKKDLNWELLAFEAGNETWDENIKFYSDKDYDGFFKRWYGWTGGDIGRSATLGDGRSIWVWGDSHTGEVLSGRKRQGGEKAQFERNFIITQDAAEDFSAFRLINEGIPGMARDKNNPNPIKELFIPTDDEGNPYKNDEVWYWPAGSVVYYRDGVPELQVVLSRIKKHVDPDNPNDSWAFLGDAADLAILSLPDLKLKEIIKNKHVIPNITRIEKDDKGEDKKVIYGLEYAGYTLKDDDGTVYIYGSGDIPGICTRLGFVARVKSGDLTNDWEFYDNKTKQWSTNISWQGQWKDGDDPDPVLKRWEEAAMATNPIFVFKDGGKYFGLTQPGKCFSSKIEVYETDSPYGPFKNPKVVGVLPSEINSGDYFSSLLAVHPQYSKNGELFFSVSKNTNKPLSTWFEDKEGSADTYLPYFFRSKNWRDKLNISSLDATDNKGILTAQYEDGVLNITDNSEKTVYSTPSGHAWIQYESLTPVKVARYTLTSAPDSPEKDPLHWKLLGSNDGESWTTIDERYYAEFEERSQTASYTVLIDGEFTHLRLDVLDSKGGSGLQIAEWQIFGKFDYDKETTAELEEVIINDEPLESISDVIFIDIPSTDPAEYILDFKAKNYGNLKNDDNIFTVKELSPGVNVYSLKTEIKEPGLYTQYLKVISEDEKNEKEYKLVFSRRYPFEDLIKVKWDNTLMLYMNKLSDYNITGYQWYKNDSPISGETNPSYSAGAKKDDLLDRNATYYVSMKTADGDLRTEAKKVTLKNMGVQAYPNPAQRGQAITVEANISEELLSGATIEVHNINGNKVNTIKVNGSSTTVDLPPATGTYLLQFKGKEGFEKTLKVVVK